VTAVLLLAFLGGSAFPMRATLAQQDVRLKSDLVEVRAVVQDRSGKVVTGLKKEDFEVLEEGKLQDIAFFSFDGPLPQGDLTEPEAQQPARGERAIVLFIDTLHLSNGSYLRMKRILRKFINERLKPNDMVAILTSGGAMGLFNRFTRDRRLLVYALERIAPEGKAVSNSRFTPYLAAMVDQGDREALDLAIAAQEAEEGSTPTLLADRRMAENYARARARVILAESAHWRKSALGTLDAAVAQMAEMPGQRLVFYISEGFSLRGNGGLDTADINRAISRAVRSGVIIYSMDAKGLEPNRLLSDVSVVGAAPIGAHSYAAASESDLEDSLNALAKDTGGEAIFNTNDLAGALSKALDSNSAYYSLAYYPSEKNNGQFRRITVRVKGHPEYTVRTQRGYVPADARADKSAKKGPEDRVANAIVSPLPATGIGVVASAYYVESEDDKAQVSLEAFIDGTGLQYARTNQTHRVDLEVTTMAFDQKGSMVKRVTDTIQGNLTSERVERARIKGFRYAKRLPLDPGNYQIRIAVREPGTERIGTAIAVVEVPNLRKGRLLLSSIVLGELSPSIADNRQAFQYNLGQGIPLLKRGNLLVYSLFVYNASLRANTPNGLLMQIEISDGERNIYQGPWQSVDTRLTGVMDGRGLEIGGQIKLDDPRPGLYELHITIKGSASKMFAKQETLFEIQ
jgi:VWFA-related protein